MSPKSRIALSALGLAALVSVVLAVTAWVAAPRPVDASRKAVGHWTRYTCIKPQSSSVCRDVYSDDSGNLWLCGACGETKAPNPSSCRPLTSAEFSSGTYCGGN